MRFSWAVIAIVNCTWCAILWRRRRRDHPWLLRLYATYCITDTFMLISSPPEYGGLDFLGAGLLGYHSYLVFACVAWTAWFNILVVCAYILQRGRVPAWCIAFMVVGTLLLSFSELLGASTQLRRLLMHSGFEPILLLIALVTSGRYIAQQISRGGRIDFLAYAVILTSFMFAIRLLLMLDKDLELNRAQSHALFYFYQSVVVATYFGTPRFRRWLLSR